ncbi:MAG TPA: DUF6082 family protein [Candidatus Limnocylindrales bacterium]|nr:DUF6082 family protein [Candidatus Limnocylindrales bacterium]
MSNRRPLETLAVVIVAATVLMFLLVSPILFSIAADFKPDSHSWADLANIGQAYGGAAALVSALALAGIAGSLIMQWRQTSLDQTFAMRERHFELVRLGIERPELIQALGARPDPNQAMVFAYANLWLSHWASYWDLGILDERHLRLILRDFFKNPQIREWWNEHEGIWSSSSTVRRLKFVQIVSEECATIDASETNPTER